MSNILHKTFHMKSYMAIVNLPNVAKLNNACRFKHISEVFLMGVT